MITLVARIIAGEEEFRRNNVLENIAEGSLRDQCLIVISIVPAIVGKIY